MADSLPQKNNFSIYDYYSETPIAFMYTFVPPPKELLCTFPKFHLELSTAAEKNRYVAVAAPRGSAKSTVLAFLKPLHSILFKKKKFILLISNTFTKSILTLQSIKIAVQKNPMILEMFKGITLTKDSEGDTEFQHPDGFTTKVLCRGVDQLGATRGVKFGDYRPDLIIGDDMEDDELVRSAERRIQLQSDFDDALIPTGDRNTQYIFIGTILHYDSLLAKLVSPTHYPEYHKLIYRARYEENGEKKSLWAEKWSVADLDKMEKEKPSTFSKEMQNDPVSGVNVRFNKSDFRYWRNEGNRYILFGKENEVLTTGLISECRAAIACDLAWKEKRSSGADSTVILPGFLTPDSNLLIEDYVHKTGMRPDEFIEQIFLMVDRLERLTGASVPVGFEKAMLENVTQWMMRKQMKFQNKFIMTKELVWDADKETRIEIRLQPRYSQHSIFHKQGMGDLEEQLIRFPSASHDDIIDAEQGLVQLLKYPKGVRTKEDVGNLFDQLRQHAIDHKKPKHEFHGFGNKNSGAGWRIPAKKTFF